MFPVSKNLLVIIAVTLGIIFLFNAYNEQNTKAELPFSEFTHILKSGQVTEALLKGDMVYFYTGNQKGVSRIPRFYTKLPQLLHENGVRFKVETDDGDGLFFAILSSWLPILLIIGVWLFFMKQMQGGNKVMGFGKSKPRMIDETNNRITFADVAGIEEAKGEVDEIVDFLKDPGKFKNLGGKIPTGVLLAGQPGTGKHSWRKPLPEKPALRFSVSVVPISWKCL